MKSTVIRLGSAAALLLLATPLAADAQQAGKVYRIGYLNPNPAPSVSAAPFRASGFIERLRDRGWIVVINMKTAKALGLTIPPSLLLRADQIIE